MKRKSVATQARASSDGLEEDVDGMQVPTPAPNKRQASKTTTSLPAAPKYQDIGISQLVLGAGGSSILAEATLASQSIRAANHHFRGLTIDTLKTACDHLALADPRLAPLIEQHGMPERLLAKGPGAFATLSKSICFQQLATKAAAAIFGRVLTACQCDEAGVLNPVAVLSTKIETLCGAGLSKMKASYLHDLSRHFHEGLLSDDLIDAMNNEQLHTALTAVRGLGPWSVDMFAMFHLGLPDCLPVGDLGVKRGMQTLYKMSKLPTPKEMEAIAEQWRPYRSVGSYYMWRVEVPRSSGSGKNKKK